MLAAIVLLIPAGASANCECTNTWVGPAEGSWNTAENWSTGEVPGSEDTVCIGSGKTVEITSGSHQISRLMGKGALYLQESTLEISDAENSSSIAELTMSYEGNLGGAGDLEVTEAFSWEGQSTMSGSGETVLGSEAASTIGSGNVAYTLDGRKLVNKGTVSQPSYGRLNIKKGGTFENLGTYTLNGEASLWQVTGEGAESIFLNKGTLRKTEGTGDARINSVSFENEGTLKAETGEFLFDGSSVSLVLADESLAEGRVVCEDGSAALHTITAPNAELDCREAQITVPSGESASIGELTLRYEGDLDGAGDLAVTKAFDWEGQSTISGSGKTVLGSSSDNTIGGGNVFHYLEDRTLVNEGTLSQPSYGILRIKKGGTFENLGTYTLNGELRSGRFSATVTNRSS